MSDSEEEEIDVCKVEEFDTNNNIAEIGKYFQKFVTLDITLFQ